MAGRKPKSVQDGIDRYHAFRLPSPQFDIAAASDRELSLHGLPRRPNPETHPRLTKKWEDLTKRRFEFITPEFAPSPFKRGIDRALIERRAIFAEELARYDAKLSLRDRQVLFDLKLPVGLLGDRISLVEILRDFPALTSLLPQTSSNWSGAFVRRPPPRIVLAGGNPRSVAESLRTVTATWNVNGISAPSRPADGTYLVGVWVGIDGTAGSNDVLQAGTAAQCIVKGGKVTSTTYFAWTEWFALPAITVANFPVVAGDQISCTVCAPFENTHGVAMFNNLTSGLTVTIGIDPPAGTKLAGNVAEWIVEDPTQGSGALFPFPLFGSIFFNGCIAGSQDNELDLSSATEIDLVQGGVTLSSGVIQSKTSLWCHDGP